MALAGTTTSSVTCRAATGVVGDQSWWILRRPFGRLPLEMPGKRCPPQDVKFRNCYGRPAALAYGRGAGDGFPSSMNEDTDEMFDELFNKYGKVVFSRNDKQPPNTEIDDDSESLSFAMAMAKVASEVKAADIKVLFVKPLVYWTRFFIIATAFSRPQIDAIWSKMRDLAEKKYGKVPSGDAKPNSWTLLDYGADNTFSWSYHGPFFLCMSDVVVHIFLPQQRTFYNLEEFYGNATPIELPFESQPPFRPTN